MCTGLADAETLKKNFGNAVPTLIPEGNQVEVPSVGDRPSRMMPQRMAGEILEPRARELFELLRDNLRHAGVLEHCIAGFVLSGGASRLPGILDVAESVLRKAARLASPIITESCTGYAAPCAGCLCLLGSKGLYESPNVSAIELGGIARCAGLLTPEHILVGRRGSGAHRHPIIAVGGRNESRAVSASARRE